MRQNHEFSIRPVLVGGMARPALLAALQRAGVACNAAAETLLASALFAAATPARQLSTAEVAVGDLGFPEGTTTGELYARAAQYGLALCPPELGPYFRLAYLDQPEGALGQPIRTHQAPYGAITIASPPLSDDDTVPKGFYVRRIEGVLWLRGYRAGLDHVWQSDDHFLFCLP